MFGQIAATMLGMPNHPAPPLVVDEAELATLRSLSRAGRTEQRLATRARIVLRAVEGQPNTRIATELRVAPMTVLLWRRRFERDRLAGLRDAPRPGRERIYSRTDRDRVIALTLSEPPAGLSHWSSRRLAREVGMSTRTVQRIWSEAGLQPHRTETFKWSTDPELEAKVRDVVGLYLSPPERAIVLSLDEKTQIQALGLPAARRPDLSEGQGPRRARQRQHPHRPRTSRPGCAGTRGSRSISRRPRRPG